MKKLVLLLMSAFLMSAAAQAQATFVAQSDPSDTVSLPFTSGSLNVNNYIKSVSGLVYLKWHVVSYDIPAGWSLTGVCDNHACRSVSQTLAGDNFVSDAYFSNAFADFHAIFDGSSAASGTSAYVTVMITDTTAGYSRMLTFRSYKNATGISNVSSNQDFNLWPSPAREAVNVLFDASADVRVATVYNLIGKAVSVFKVNGNSARLDVDNLPSGVYLLRLFNAQGDVVATRKFTHQ